MAKARSFLNERRITKKQVAAYLSAGVVHRPDLDEPYNGPRPMHRAGIYDLGDGRFCVSLTKPNRASVAKRYLQCRVPNADDSVL